MKGIIVGPSNNGEGVYTLVAEDGDGMCSHFCSSSGYAIGDLYSNRPERKEMFDKKGITEVVYLAQSGITKDELLKRNKEYFEAHKDDKKKLV
jgi:hypothetical protein